MGAIDVDALLEEVSADAQCGEDLEYDADFVEMQRVSQGKPEQQYGNTIIEAEEPDYREVKRLALGLMRRTKDLRVASLLAQAAVRTDGLPGFSGALQVVRGLMDRYWEPLHPRLDPDDDNDPTLRVNTLVALCHPDATLRGVREAPVVRSRTVGSFSFRDYLIATGEIAGPKSADPPPELATIEAAFRDCEIESLQATTDAVRQGIEAFRECESLLTQNVGASKSADLSALPKELRRIESLLAGWLTRRGASSGSAASAEAADASAPTNGSGAAGPGVVPVVNGEIRTRDDVARALDRICEYYERYEPSSPLPLLLLRAKRLVSKNFLEVLRDLVPTAVAEAERLRGVDGAGEASNGSAAAAPAQESSGW